MSKYIDADLLKSTRGLYFDIDTCITELLRARVEKNKDVEGKALFRMEGLMVATLQHLSCIIDSLQQEQQEVDLKKVVMIDNVIMNMTAEGYNNGYKTRPFYEEVLRRFNARKE